MERSDFKTDQDFKLAELMKGYHSDHPEYWRVRGVGSNGGWPSLVTGKDCNGPDISGFVTSYEAGQRVVAMFGGRAKLDYRPSEPNWIQVKVLVEEEHKAVLNRLYEVVLYQEYILTTKVILWALFPDIFTGNEPHGLKSVKRATALLKGETVEDVTK